MDLKIPNTDFIRIGDVKIPDSFFKRLKTDNEVVDEMFGGKNNPGILPGSTMTLIAKQGAGKSVFSLTLGEMLTNRGYNVAYATGEESIEQIAYNSKRLNVENLKVGVVNGVGDILNTMENHDFLIVDSFQTLRTSEDLTGTKKTKYLVDNLVSHAKNKECSTLFIVQETTSGEMRGGNMLAYAVDVNMRILKNPENEEQRLIETYKNRFGPCFTTLSGFGKSGYEFLGKYENLKNMKEGKTSIKEVRKLDVLALDGLITMSIVENLLGISSQTARIILVELENEGKLLKYGRGPSAIWKKL